MLKIGKLTHQDIGQMDSYIRMFDALYKNEDDNPTLGIILCSEKSEAIVKYSVLNDKKNIFASKYGNFSPDVTFISSSQQIVDNRIYSHPSGNSKSISSAISLTSFPTFS